MRATCRVTNQRQAGASLRASTSSAPRSGTAAPALGSAPAGRARTISSGTGKEPLVQTYVLFEDDGDLKAGTVRSATDTSLQVDSTTGKRIKVKAGSVLMRFERPRADELLPAAQAEAAQMDTDFLWQCAPQQEFGFEQLASEYFGHEPTPVESTAILLRLQSAPVYFQRKGRGQFRPATPEVLHLALAAVERRRLQDEQRARMVHELTHDQLPAPIAALGARLLIQPDRNSIEFKAMEQAAHELQLSPLRLLLARGAIASPYAWHLESFLARTFPRGVGFAGDLPPPPDLAAELAGLPLAAAPVFSIDDSATTEIDDAFSVRYSASALVIGVHIAAPSLAIAAGDALDILARTRMSTVYAPGLKYTMLPQAWVDAFSLTEGKTVPSLSLYFELDPHSLALRAEREKIRGKPEPQGREEVSLLLDGEGAQARVRLFVRRRDAPLDRIVAELMICANRHWGAWLEEQGLVGIYRSQAQGRVRMSTTPAPHDGLGVRHYAWCTSPLRRYVDLLNQRQLIAAASGAPPPHRRGDAELFAVVSGFDAAYTTYGDFQETMERYWSLRWLQQEGVRYIDAVVGRGDIVRLRGLPMSTRVAGAAGMVRGQRLQLELVEVDLIELSPNARIVQVYQEDEQAPAADGAALDAVVPAANPVTGAEAAEAEIDELGE
jgi:exoribonuclease-2